MPVFSTLKVPLVKNQAFNVVYMSSVFICFKTNHVRMHNAIAEYFLFKTAVNQRQSQKHNLKSLMFLTSQTSL